MSTQRDNTSRSRSRSPRDNKKNTSSVLKHFEKEQHPEYRDESDKNEQKYHEFSRKSSEKVHPYYDDNFKKTCINFLKGQCSKTAEECDNLHLKTKHHLIAPESFDGSLQNLLDYKLSDAELFNLNMTSTLSKLPNKDEGIILIRHGLSIFNYVIYRFFHETGITYSDPKSAVYQTSDIHIDSPLHPLGEQMCVNSRGQLAGIQFHTVFVSPLIRTIQTTQLFFKGYPNTKFILLPLITERICMICDIANYSKSIEQCTNSSEDQKISFDSSYLLQEGSEQWQIKSILKRDISQVEEQTSPERILFEEIKTIYPNPIESSIEFNQRTQKAKQFIQEYIQNNNIDTSEQKIGVVSHLGFLKAFTALGVDENNQPIPGKILDNVEVLPFKMVV